MKVPQSIKDHYRSPQTHPASASAEDLRHYNIPLPLHLRIRERLTEKSNDAAASSSFDAASAEQILWLKTLVQLQSDLAHRIEKEKTKALFQKSESRDSLQTLSSPKPLKELARLAFTVERAEPVLNVTRSHSADVSSVNSSVRSRIASNDDVRSTSLQRLKTPAKRRNSDPQSNATSQSLGLHASKRSRRVDSIRVFRPIVLPSPNVPFTKLELTPKGVVPVPNQTNTTLVNGEASEEAAVAVEKTIKVELANAGNDLAKITSQNSLHNSKPIRKPVVLSKLKPQKLPETGFAVNGYSETSSFESDEDALTAGKCTCLFVK